MLTKYDLKKLALLGIIGGMMVGSPAFAGEDEGEKPADEPETEANGCSGENGCGGSDESE